MYQIQQKENLTLNNSAELTSNNKNDMDACSTTTDTNYSITHQNTQLTKDIAGKFSIEHYDYLRYERYIPQSWVLANFESLTQKEAQEKGFSASSDGILLSSALPCLQEQFRPDKPKVITKPDGTKRAIKYLTVPTSGLTQRNSKNIVGR